MSTTSVLFTIFPFLSEDFKAPGSTKDRIIHKENIESLIDLHGIKIFFLIPEDFPASCHKQQFVDELTWT